MKKFTFLKKTMILSTLVASFLFVVSCDSNQKQESKDTKVVAEDRNDDRFDNDEREDDAQFLVDASEINMEQIQLGKLAQQKGRTSHVKELGKKMESAHTKSQKELTALAKSKNITIPTTPTDDVNDRYKKLNDKSDDDFDKAYCNRMVKGHKDAISKFEKASKESNDPDIRNWATNSLPGMRKHLDQCIEGQKKFSDMHFEEKK